MTVMDFAKALGVALLLMVLNVAAAFGVMAVYGMAIAPGHEPEFYRAAAERIAPWSSIFAGAVLFFVAARWLAWRRAGRNGFAFATTFALIYAAIDVSIIAAEGVLLTLSAMVTGSMISKLAAALLGAWLGRPRFRPSPPPASPHRP